MSDLAGLGLAELRGLLRARQVSAVEVVRAHLARIEGLDPTVRAFLRTNPAAEREAEAADALLVSGDAPALAGIPVAVKDNIATAGLETTCGSHILDGFAPVRDATVVERLRRAGAIILGKTNLDEFAMGSSTENSAWGPSRNPWDLERVPGGSSGGSAVAVATGMAPVGLGSETGGSVRQPAAFCGVVGLKPTYGRVSRSGLVAFGSSLDQVGAFAARVADCAAVLSAVAGADPADATSSTVPVDDYEGACGRGVDGLTVGLPREYEGEGLDPRIAEAVHAAAGVLARSGARVVDVSLPHTRYAIPTYYIVATAEASSNLARYDGVRYGRRRGGDGDLRDMYRATRGQGFGAEVKRRIMLGTYALSAGYYEAYYGKAMKVRTLLRRDFHEAWAAGVDLLLAPTTPTPAFRVGDKVDDPLAMYLSDVYTATMNLAGVPALSVPVGRTSENLPIGAQLVAPDFRESLLFRAAAVLEHAFGRLVPPPLVSSPASPGSPSALAR